MYLHGQICDLRNHVKTHRLTGNARDFLVRRVISAKDANLLVVDFNLRGWRMIGWACRAVVSA